MPSPHALWALSDSGMRRPPMLRRSGPAYRHSVDIHTTHKELCMNIRPLILAVASAVALMSATGCAVLRDQESVGAYIDDTALTTRVKAKFAENKVVSAMSISVETLKGVVQLAGFAKSEDERDTAGRLARETSGVKSVRNDIVVRA